ncbi:hypothetical protein MHU86_12894 [Fragilaria crotonensis]|nr:hypothetical protein MHU86_12894 [Fragilaria crotonensis]
MAARTYLLASLSTELSNKVTEKLDDSDSFPVVWLQFLKSIQSTSIERFEDLKAIIKARLPSQYSGENLEQLAAHFRKDANELTTAGQYDHNLTLAMLKIFLLAGGSGNEDFRFPEICQAELGASSWTLDSRTRKLPTFTCKSTS